MFRRDGTAKLQKHGGFANAWFAAKCAYPEQFADIDMTEKLNEVTGAFLGKGIAEDIYRMPNSFGGYQQIDTAAFFS